MTRDRADGGSLDDLLRYEEEPPHREPRPQTGWTWVATTAAYSLALAGVVVFSARALGVGLPFAVVFSLTFALLALHRVVQAVAPGPHAAEPERVASWEDPEIPSTPDGAIGPATRWDTRLSWTQSDPDRFARTVLPVLAEIADERLRQRHGVTRASDPARARELLGDPLWTFLSTPVTRSLTPRQLAAIVAHLEAI